MEKTPSKKNHLRGGIAFALALTGAAALGPVTYYALQTYSPKSEVVAGTPGQVEAHLTRKRCAMHMGASCLNWTTEYGLRIEQCPRDVLAAKEGRLTESFDPQIGKEDPACYVGTVSVTQAVYDQYEDGATIVLAGPVGTRLLPW